MYMYHMLQNRRVCPQLYKTKNRRRRRAWPS